MTQNLGSTSNPLSMTGEQWVLEERTDDPLSPEPGECWIRTDLNAGDKIATLKFGDGSEVPIFPTATSETGVLEVRRVQTGGQTGYLPVADLDFATFPQFRLQHNNTVYGLHNDIEAVASLSIDTLEAEDIESDSVTIRGEITEINAGGDDATVRFDWGESNAGLPNTTADQLQGTTGIFSEGLTGLTDDTQYEFRAEGEVRDVFDEGAILSFTTPSAVLDSDLTQIADHLWYMDEASGGSIADSEGTADGTINGATWVTDQGGVGDAYLDFSGSDDVVNFGNMFTTEGEFTVSGWVQHVGNGTQGYLFQQGVSDFLIQLGDFSGDVDASVQLFVGGENTDSIEAELGTDRIGDWIMLTGTYASGTGRLFCHHIDDGLLVDETVSTSDPSWDSGDDFTMGNREDLQRPITDGADMGLVARQEVSESEVLDHYNQSKEFFQ